MNINNSTTAWIWVAAMEAGDGKPVKKKAILDAADFINKAVPTDQEFGFAINELVKREFLLEQDGLFKPTDRSVTMYKSLRKKTKQLLKLINLFELTLDKNA